MIKDLNEAILNIGQTRKNKYGDDDTNDILYSRWHNRYSKTIGDFYYDFIKPRLPKPETVLKWHKMLMKYCEMDDAIFPIRDGHTNADDDKLKLRRGWLVRVDYHLDYDKKFSYTFTDNYFPAYIYKMALDGYCPTVAEFYNFMTTFKYPEEIDWLNGKAEKVEHPTNDSGEKRKFLIMPIRFGQVGKPSYPGNTETKKNAYINTSPAPACQFGDYGYKHAHIFAVKDKKGLYWIEGDDIEWKNIEVVELGEESYAQQDYVWDDSIKNFAWHRIMNNSQERDKLRKVVVAHFLRFVDPINHFLSPMQGSNKFTKSNGDYSLDIGEYDKLLLHLMFIREKEFGKDYEDFQKAVLAPSGMKSGDYSAEAINIIYHEDNQKAASRKNKEDQQKENDAKKAAKRLAKEAEKAAQEAKKEVGKEAKKAATSTSAAAGIASGKIRISTKSSGSKKGASDKTYEIAAYYLRHAEGMSIVGTKLLPTPDPNGSKTKSRLKPIGILGKHKGLLMHTNIDDAIANSTDSVFKKTLEEIKKRGL